MANVKIWMRLGITLDVPQEIAQKILTGDETTLLAVINDTKPNRMWYADGDSYIPDVIAEELGFNGDINFEL